MRKILEVENSTKMSLQILQQTTAELEHSLVQFFFELNKKRKISFVEKQQDIKALLETTFAKRNLRVKKELQEKLKKYEDLAQNRTIDTGFLYQMLQDLSKINKILNKYK